MKKRLGRLQCKFGHDNVSFLRENGWSDFYETIFFVLYNVWEGFRLLVTVFAFCIYNGGWKLEGSES